MIAMAMVEKNVTKRDAQTNRERYPLRWQSTVECICNERVYDHAILLSCKHINSEFVPGATSSHALLSGTGYSVGI